MRGVESGRMFYTDCLPNQSALAVEVSEDGRVVPVLDRIFPAASVPRLADNVVSINDFDVYRPTFGTLSGPQFRAFGLGVKSEPNK